MQTCTRCIYNENIPGISFDENGVCNYCKIHDNMCTDYPTGKTGWEKLTEIASKIKKEGKNKEVDCVVGVSGGCDSTYMLHILKQLGLHPIAAHFDNTWNSTIAVENIYNTLKKLDIELYTYVVNNSEFNDLCKSFLKASVTDGDIPNDIGLATVMYMAAEKYKVKYIFNGHSFRTEGIAPIGWTYMDAKYIQSVHAKFGSCDLRTFPNLWLSHWLKWLGINRIKQIRPLYYVDYVKEHVKKLLAEQYDWQWYGGHHMENKYTRFQKNYYLPKKFGIDKRFVEFSALVRSGQMSRNDALEKIRAPLSFSDEELQEIKSRLNMTDEEFSAIMSSPKKAHTDYETYHSTFRRMKPLFWAMYKADMVPKSFYVKYTK